MTTTSAHSHAAPELDNSTFDSLADAAQARWNLLVGAATPVFTTDATGLYDLYLNNLPAEERQHHTCNGCRHFIERFGSLAVIENGRVHSAMWFSDIVPMIFMESVYAMARAVNRSRITGVFLSSDKVLGTPVTGQWHHFGIKQDPQRLYRDGVLDAHQAMAQKRQDFITLEHGLRDFAIDPLKIAVSILEAEEMYRGEKVMGPAKFLLDLQVAIAKAPKTARDNLIWQAVATAPVGFATPRSSMVGTLLEDIVNGRKLEVVKKRFAAKMHPLLYRRPQAAPAAGNIEAAEKLVDKLGIASALRRRYARFEEVPKVWLPAAQKPTTGAPGVFSDLKPKVIYQKTETILPAQTMTWVKFLSKVLPNAISMQVRLTSRMNFYGMATASDPDAKPIHQWDREEARFPFSTYLYVGGSTPRDWGLEGKEWALVTGIAVTPGADLPNHGNQALFILDGAKDQRGADMAIFPETLKAELHSIRATIEAFSRNNRLEGASEGTGNGVIVGGKDVVQIMVKTDLGSTLCTIDRWD